MTQFAFFNGKIVPIAEAHVSVMTHGLNYGTGCFGGIRGYWNAEQQQLYVFRILDHYTALSAQRQTVDDGFGPALRTGRITVDLLSREAWTELLPSVRWHTRPPRASASNSTVWPTG
ncbi:MAG: hypothetical protein R2873_30380 [Caldilineaceae bacterium]